MTPDTFHVLVLILSVLVFFILIWKYRNWNGFFKRLPLASVAFVFMFIIFGILLSCLCDENDPVFQWLIPAVCLFFILLGTENKKVKIFSAIFFVLIAGFLSWHFNHLVYHSNYTTNSRTKQRLPGDFLEHNKERLKEISAEYDESYLTGWAEEVFKELPSEKTRMIYQTVRTDAYELWHTSFTGLYRKSEKNIYLWYPGGKLAEAANKIEWKEK